MNQNLIEHQFQDLAIDNIEYFEQISSTNDAASLWLNMGGQGRYLAVADEQLQGRGRDGRKWQTPPNSALAFTLAFAQDAIPIEDFALVNGYVSVAICRTIENNFQLKPKIKWPNDILLDGKKVSGILSEAHWQSNKLQSLIIGVGINVASSSISGSSQFQFPATFLDEHSANAIDRTELLHDIVRSIYREFSQQNKTDLLNAWESRLAFKNEKVELHGAKQHYLLATLIGLDLNGRIKLLDESGQAVNFAAGEIRLRSINE